MEDTVLLLTFIVSMIAIGIGMLAMAIGAMTTGRCLHGSCGGSPAGDAPGDSPACANCPNRRNAA